MIRRWLCAAALFAALGSTARAQNVNTPALITLTAQGAGTIVGPDMGNSSFRGVVVGVNLTTLTTATATVHVQGKDAISGVYYDILVSAGLISTGFTSLTVYPGAAVISNVSAGQPLPATWRVEAVVTGGSAVVTGTIDASLIQ